MHRCAWPAERTGTPQAPSGCRGTARRCMPARSSSLPTRASHAPRRWGVPRRAVADGIRTHGMCGKCVGSFQRDCGFVSHHSDRQERRECAVDFGCPPLGHAWIVPTAQEAVVREIVDAAPHLADAPARICRCKPAHVLRAHDGVAVVVHHRHLRALRWRQWQRAKGGDPEVGRRCSLLDPERADAASACETEGRLLSSKLCTLHVGSSRVWPRARSSTHSAPHPRYHERVRGPASSRSFVRSSERKLAVWISGDMISCRVYSGARA
jgi:hypothetical protein